MTLAILSAMEEECVSLIEHMQIAEQIAIAGRIYYKGRLWDKDVVIVFSRWGKVAAASTTVVLIREFGATEILFTGVAGAIDTRLNVGDIVIGNTLYQHDMDVRPMLARYEIPLLGTVGIKSDATRQEQIYAAANVFVNTQINDYIPKESIEEFNIGQPKVVLAGIATGDQFITCNEQSAHIINNLPDVVCVEMEGGAVAQVCSEYEVSFSIIRTISDSANAESSIDFQRFVTVVAKQYSLGIVKNLFKKISSN